MSDFLIQSSNGKCRVSRIISGDLEPVQFRGELSISSECFWEKFKSKIEYIEGDDLAFIIITEECDFIIEPNIKISDKFLNTEKDITWVANGFIQQGFSVMSFPDLETQPINNMKQDANLVDSTYSNINQEEQLFQSSGLQVFYRNKTRDYNRS